MNIEIACDIIACSLAIIDFSPEVLVSTFISSSIFESHNIIDVTFKFLKYLVANQQSYVYLLFFI